MTEQRRYSLDEIDQMREATRCIYRLNSNFEVKEVEERLRTFMFNGTAPEELIERAARIRHEEREKARQRPSVMTFEKGSGW